MSDLILTDEVANRNNALLPAVVFFLIQNFLRRNMKMSPKVLK